VIDSSIEELFDSINNSKEYKEYNEIMSIIKDNSEVNGLIEEIKVLQKEATYLEYNNDDRYIELDKEIKIKSEMLNNNEDYKEYLSKLKKFNSVLVASSSLLQDYVDSKVTV